MNMHSTIKADPCAVPFEPAISREQMAQLETVCHGFGVNRRVVLLLATQSRDEMANALRALSAAEGDELTTLELVTSFTRHCEALAELAKSVEARVFLAYHDALGLSLEQTCPITS